MHQELHFQLPIGNAVELRLKLKFTDGEEIPVSAIYDTHITMGVGGRNMQEYDYTTDGSSLCIQIPADQELGSYDVHVNSHIDGREIASHYKGLIQRVQWGMAVPVPLIETDMIIFGESDEEITDLKERLRAAIEEAQESKAEADAKAEEYADKIQHLDDVAKESSLSAIATMISGRFDNVMTKIADLWAYVADRFDGTISAIENKIGDLNSYVADRFNGIQYFIADQIEGLLSSLAGVKNSADSAASMASATYDQAQTYEANASNRHAEVLDVVNAQAQALGVQIDGVSDKIDRIDISDLAKAGEYNEILARIESKVSLTAQDAINDWNA